MNSGERSMSRGHGEKLSRKQEHAILALLSHSTIQAAAQACGVSESTLRRWNQLPDFQAAYRDACHEMVRSALSNLQQASGQAVTCLQAIMSDTTASASSRAAAAKTVLELTLKTMGIEELEERVRTIEE